MAKFVDGWHVSLLPNGVYMVTFDLTERGLFWHRYDDTKYSFEDCEDNFEDIEIPKFLPNKGYLKSSSMNKTQCTFYYVPYDLNTITERKIILTSK